MNPPGAGSHRRAAILAAAWIGLAPVAWAADPSDAEMPLGAERIQVEGGYKWDYVAGRKSDGWYKVMYRGTSLAERGVPAPVSDTVVADAAAIDRSVADRADLALRFEQGTLALAGGLFDMDTVRPFKLGGLDKLDLRGTAFVASDRHFDQINAAIGIESPSLHPLGRDRGVANWVVIGVNGQRRESTDAMTGDATFATATYRAFVGKAFYTERDVEGERRRVLAELQKVGATFDQAKATVEGAAELSALQKQLRTAVRLYPGRVKSEEARHGPLGDQDRQAIWTSMLEELARGRGKTKAEHPVFAIYAEASGWYEFRSKADGSRQKNLVTLTLDYWFMPGRDDVLLRVRYENGFERGVPGEKKNQLLASVALRF